MSDYTLQSVWSDRDGLEAGAQRKAISATVIGNEFSAIATMSQTKYDSDDMASEAQAELLSATDKIISPGTLGNVLQDNAGIAYDLQQLASPGADRLLFWDQDAAAAKFLVASTGLSISGTNITTDDSAIVHDSLSGFVANEHIDHSGVSVIAGTGLTGGGAITSSVTLNVIAGLGLTASADDIYLSNQAVSTSVPVGITSGALTYDPSSITAFGDTTAVDLNVDEVLIEDSDVTKLAKCSSLVQPQVQGASATNKTMANSDFGQVINLSGTAQTCDLPTGLMDGFWAVIVWTGASGDLTFTATGGTLRSANSLTKCSQQYGMITCVHLGSNEWVISGALDS